IRRRRRWSMRITGRRRRSLRLLRAIDAVIPRTPLPGLEAELRVLVLDGRVESERALVLHKAHGDRAEVEPLELDPPMLAAVRPVEVSVGPLGEDPVGRAFAARALLIGVARDPERVEQSVEVLLVVPDIARGGDVVVPDVS